MTSIPHCFLVLLLCIQPKYMSQPSPRKPAQQLGYVSSFRSGYRNLRTPKALQVDCVRPANGVYFISPACSRTPIVNLEHGHCSLDHQIRTWWWERTWYSVRQSRVKKRIEEALSSVHQYDAASILLPDSFRSLRRVHQLRGGYSACHSYGVPR
jgi:hypothetical protein